MSRDAILAAIRANKPAARPLPDVPLFDELPAADPTERFVAAFKAMGGTLLTGTDGDPLRGVRSRVAEGQTVVSMVPEVAGNRSIDRADDPASLADVEIAVVRAAFAIAETGSIALTETELGINTLGYLAQHLVVLLDPADILGNVHHAYHRPELSTSRYCVFHTGPSATADIEGVLIHGAQGVRSLSLLLLKRT